MKTPFSFEKYRVETCRFEDVLPLWRDQLWPGRKSPIEPTSAMKWLSGFSATTEPASYWRITVSTSLPAALEHVTTVAVASGHFAGIIDGRVVGLPQGIRGYRVRGIWVHPDFRKQGMAHALMQTAMAQALKENCPAVWIYPRKSSFSLYESMGFTKVGDWISNEDAVAQDLGANCFAIVASEVRSASAD